MDRVFVLLHVVDVRTLITNWTPMDLRLDNISECGTQGVILKGFSMATS